MEFKEQPYPYLVFIYFSNIFAAEARNHSVAIMSSKSDSKDQCDSVVSGWTHIEFSDIEMGEKIGGGGVGLIYKGWFQERPVAVKTLFDSRIDERLKKEYMDELLVMSKVRHSNIVEFIGASMTPPNLCFVMELCESSLFNLIHVDKIQFSEHQSLQMALDVASAMEYLHAQKPAICHRDLKSHNVLRAYNGALKVCDFGLVSVQSAQAGTPAYMPPELFENKHFNKSVDVYSFGVLLWEIMSQSIPFNMVSLADIRERVCSGERPRMPSFGCPARCAKLINDCWYFASRFI